MAWVMSDLQSSGFTGAEPAGGGVQQLEVKSLLYFKV
jgi:hypothetical protein